MPKGITIHVARVLLLLLLLCACAGKSSGTALLRGKGRGGKEGGATTLLWLAGWRRGLLCPTLIRLVYLKVIIHWVGADLGF